MSMQTRQPHKSARPATRMRRSAAALALAAILPLAACSAPRLDGRAEAEWEPSACESALYDALDHDDVATSTLPIMQRYFAAYSAWSEWLDVAANCPARFDEGVIRAAQAANRAVTLGTRLGVDEQTWADRVYADVLSNEDQCDQLATQVDLANAALAEDRAGFAVEVLTAHDVADTSLSLSDWHKTIASLLASAADEDLRQSVYDVSVLLNEPDTTIDEANGLRASTVAIIEMDCARSLIEAADAGGSTDDEAGSDAGIDADESSDGGDGGDATDSTDASTDDSADIGDADGTDTDATDADYDGSVEALHAYAALASTHIYHAFRLGYPAFDEALLDSSHGE